ncbi:ABC transporter permease [Pseudobowmanella zhangzhouensis]
MQAFNSIMLTLTAVVGLLASVSLVIAGILIMNLSLISVQQRRAEIGLLKVLGAHADLVARLFVTESLLLVGIAGLLGLGLSSLIIWLANQWVPIITFVTPWWSPIIAMLLALLTAWLFSYM